MRIFPAWRVLGGNLAAISRVPLPWGERLHLAAGVFRSGNWHRRQLFLELFGALHPNPSRIHSSDGTGGQRQ